MSKNVDKLVELWMMPKNNNNELDIPLYNKSKCFTADVVSQLGEDWNNNTSIDKLYGCLNSNNIQIWMDASVKRKALFELKSEKNLYAQKLMFLCKEMLMLLRVYLETVPCLSAIEST